jgi:hypothetical protein
MFSTNNGVLTQTASSFGNAFFSPSLYNLRGGSPSSKAKGLKPKTHHPMNKRSTQIFFLGLIGMMLSLFSHTILYAASEQES